MIADLKGFDAFTEAQPVAAVERVLDQLMELVDRQRLESAGVNRGSAGDSYILTFAEAHLTMAAAERLQEAWRLFQGQVGYCPPINIAAHKGTVHSYRSSLYGPDLGIVASVESATSSLIIGNSVFVTERVRQELPGTPWYHRLQTVELPRRPQRLDRIAIFQLV